MKVLALDGIAKEGVDLLQEEGFMVEQASSLGEEELAQVIPHYEGLIVRSGTKVTKKVLACAERLQVIGRAGVGVDNIDVEEAARWGIQVVNAPNGNTVAAAEHTMALLLALARNVPQANNQLKGGCWSKKGLKGVELAGKVLGILGLGKIGSTVARRAQAFDMKVVGYDPYLQGDKVHKLGVELLTMEEVLAQADFLTLHLPLTSETRHLLGPKELSLVKPGVRIINVARGGVITEDALYQALLEGKVAGAALDVFEEEPVTNHPLFEMDNVIVTPHLGASTQEAQVRVAVEVAQDVAGILQGKAPCNPVNQPVGKVIDKSVAL